MVITHDGHYGGHFGWSSLMMVIMVVITRDGHYGGHHSYDS